MKRSAGASGCLLGYGAAWARAEGQAGRHQVGSPVPSAQRPRRRPRSGCPNLRNAGRWPAIRRGSARRLPPAPGSACHRAGWRVPARLHQVEVLRVVLVQNYLTVAGGRGREVVKRREAQVEGLPPGRSRIPSPYDLDARWGVERDTFWNGYRCTSPRPAAPAPPWTTPPRAAAPVAKVTTTTVRLPRGLI
jgi:hypothetical protein